MRTPQRHFLAIRRITVPGAVLFALLPLAAPAQISLSTAVDMAERSSPSVRDAAAKVLHASAAISEAKDAYVPNIIMGTSPGYAYGYPFGYPSLFNATSQSLVLSFSQPDYIRAARAGFNAANLNLKDTQQQVALDVALDYVELDHDLVEIAALDEEESYAGGLVSIEQDRVHAGVDARVNQLQAELTAAQVDEKRIHLENDADEMRQKLAHLTGLPADGLNTVSASIPPGPAFNSGAAADLRDDAAITNPAVAAAYDQAKAKRYTAFADARSNYRPVATFGAQYSFFEQFADYTKYFPRNFQYNNAALGVQITIPLFDAARRARARESAADAASFNAQADQARDTVSEQTLLARRTILELSAEQHVAQLQAELAQENLKTIDAELANGSGSPTAQPIAPTTAQKAHIEERERYEDLLDNNFSLMKVELNLLRMTGQINDWVRSSIK